MYYFELKCISFDYKTRVYHIGTRDFRSFFNYDLIEFDGYDRLLI